MEVNFNNMREQAIFAYDRLVEKLNSSIHRNDEYVEFPNGHYQSLKGCVVIDASQIKKDIDDLRQTIGIIAMTFEPGDDQFKDVYPIDRSMQVFNESDCDDE